MLYLTVLPALKTDITFVSAQTILNSPQLELSTKRFTCRYQRQQETSVQPSHGGSTPCVEVSPNISCQASTQDQAPSPSEMTCPTRFWFILGRGGTRPWLQPKPHCTSTSWTFLQKVSGLEDGPNLSFRAEPGWAFWTKTHPPGALVKPIQPTETSLPCFPWWTILSLTHHWPLCPRQYSISLTGHWWNCSQLLWETHQSEASLQRDWKKLHRV